MATVRELRRAWKPHKERLLAIEPGRRCRRGLGTDLLYADVVKHCVFKGKIL